MGRQQEAKDRDDAGTVHLADLREALALEPEGERADRVDARALRDASSIEDVLRDGRAVVRRLRVRHARDRREAAGERCRDAGRDRLLVLVPRLAQVDMHVDEPGDDEKPARVERLRLNRHLDGESVLESHALDLKVASEELKLLL